jgi:hypothetical protein
LAHQRSAVPSVPNIFIYQILNHYTKREALDPGFLVLDNSSNERPDWFEYWPMRKFLLNEPLDEAAFYGFVSPKFKLKTNLSAAAAHAFVSLETGATDVVLLSPSIHPAAYSWNTFEHGESVHPGLLDVAARFFERIGRPTNMDDLVTDSRTEVYSNFMIAKPRFWRAWLEITEQLFAIAESPGDPLGADLCKATTYRRTKAFPMKIFIVERIATWILACHPQFVVRVKDPFAARTRIYKLPTAIVCDALKIAYVTHGRRQEYKDLFQLTATLAKFLNVQVRFGNMLGFKYVRSCLESLSSHWDRAGRS